MTQNEKTEYQYDKVPTKEIIHEKQETPAEYGYGVRHVQLLLVFTSLTVIFIARGHLGVTVVAMTSHDIPKLTVLNTSLSHNLDVNYTSTQLDKSGTNDSLKMEDDFHVVDDTNEVNAKSENKDAQGFKTFKWPKSTQEMVLGSFFVGYCIMAFPIGMVVQRWGGKLPMQIALFVNGIISILTPWLTIWGGWKAVCACRIVQGLSQAGAFPSVQNLLANWAPINERASFSSYVYIGTTIGTVIGYQLSGFLAESRWGWPSTWWAIGVLCLACFALLTFFGEATPARHGRISEEEKNYILGRIDDGVLKPRQKTPWKAIFKCRPVWGILATHVGSGVAFVFCFTQAPSYIHYILKVNVKNSGVLSSLPYVASIFTSVTFGLVSDHVTKRNMISRKNARRICNSISQVGMAIALLLVSFTRSTAIAVSCLVMAMGCHMGIHSGWMVNHIDLAPNYSGAMMAVGNTFMNMLNVLLPLLVSQVVTDVTNLMQWRIMFIIIAGLAFSSNAFFVFLMTSDTQAWNDFDSSTCGLTLEETKIQDKKEKDLKEL